MTELPLRADLVGERPYGAPTDDVPVRLNVNENPYPPPPPVVADLTAAVAAELVRLNRYPDREAAQLRDALAAYVGVASDQVWPANGSNEVMHQILGAFGGPGRTLVSFTPTYSMYPVYARDTNTAYATAPRAADHSIEPDIAAELIAGCAANVVVVASPNNPTGGLLDLDEVRYLHSLIASSGVLVVDEAYIEFEPGARSAVELLPQCPRLIVLRTLSKAWGMAGLRLGYAVTSPAIVDALRVVRLPYHLSALTQAAGVAALGHASTLLAPVADLVSERRLLQQWLADHGIPAADSSANFILIGPVRDSRRLFSDLRGRGVLVRETGGPGHLRVSIGTAEENEALRAALLDSGGWRT
ncbi:MAG: histidinol-phosphate transaminase [Candidatus Nanopelagicales bacterium]